MTQSSPSHDSRFPDQSIEISSHCLFCGNRKFDEAATGVKDFFFRCDEGEFDYHRCQNCGSLWLRNRPCGERLLRAYANYYTHIDKSDIKPSDAGVIGQIRSSYIRNRYAVDESLADRIAGKALAVAGYNSPGIDEQLRFAPKAPARVLDYGCGNGEYLLRLHPLGYDLRGAEYDPKLIGNLADFGIRIVDIATLEDGQWQDEFDHITLAHVLEHVPDPLALLRRLLRWLKPGGTLYLEVPNADATGLTLFGRHWRGLEAPRHFALPGRAALIDALQKAGYGTLIQHINSSARRWVWAESMEACMPDDRQELSKTVAVAPMENHDNAEFLTFVAQRPAA